MDEHLHRIHARAQKRLCFFPKDYHFQMLFWWLDDVIVALNVIAIQDFYVE